MELLTVNTTVVELIQLSLAPVFLIVGIGQILNVVTGRLARIIDRVRWYENRQYDASDKSDASNKLRSHECDEMKALKTRMKFSNWAITFLTGAVVIICIDVTLLLINGLTTTTLNTAIIILFMLSLAALTAGLICFFIEVSVATTSIKIIVH